MIMIARISVACTMVGVLLLGGTTGACSTKCFAVAIPALRIQVVDSITNGTIGAGEVTVVAIDGAFRDSMTVSGHTSRVLMATERGGTYRVEARAPGYKLWVREEVIVTEDDCHPHPVDLVARLQRL
jgi:hypothetical protein